MKNNAAKRVMLLMITAVLMVSLSGCGASYSGTEGDPSGAAIGVVYTMDEKDKTLIQWLDDDLNVVAESRYPYAGMIISFENADVQKGRLFAAPNGQFGKSDENDAVMIDCDTGDCEAIELETDNHQATDVEDGRAVVSGNRNGKGSIDLIDLETKETTTFIDQKLWDGVIGQVALVNGAVYGTGSESDGDTEHPVICAIDVDKKTVKNIYRCKDDPEEHAPSYLERHGDDLCFIDDQKLIRYDTKTGGTSAVALSRKDADILNICGDVVWIGYTDQHAEQYDTMIEARDYGTGAVIGQASCDMPICQLEPAEKTVYVMGYDKMQRYKFEGGEITFDRDIEYDPEYEEFSKGAVFVIR